MDKKIILGSTSDFLKFISKVSVHDKATLRTYFKIACKKKSLLLVRTIGPCYAQLCIIPLNELPKIKEKINPKFAVGFAGLRIDKDTYFLFGEMIQDQEEVGQFHSGEIKPSEAFPELDIETEAPQPKKRGRKKNVESSL